MRHGFADTPYHQFIHPGYIPPPWDGMAEKICMKCPPTGIPFRNFALADYDYEAIWGRIRGLRTSVCHPLM